MLQGHCRDIADEHHYIVPAGNNECGLRAFAWKNRPDICPLLRVCLLRPLDAVHSVSNRPLHVLVLASKSSVGLCGQMQSWFVVACLVTKEKLSKNVGRNAHGARQADLGKAKWRLATQRPLVRAVLGKMLALLATVSWTR